MNHSLATQRGLSGPRKLLAWFTPTQWQIIVVALFIMVSGNISFTRQLSAVYPPADGNWGFVASVWILFWLMTAWFFSLIAWGKAARWVLALFIVVSAPAAYFMDSYGTVIDVTMLENMAQTNASEAGDLFNLQMLARLLFLGLLPAWLLIRYSKAPTSPWAECKSRLLFTLCLVLFVLLNGALFSAQYASFFREHKIVRFYANPTYLTYSSIKFLKGKTVDNLAAETGPIQDLASDAKIATQHHNELIIVVVGETVRADHFSLNGYGKKTNPNLEKVEGLVSFKQVSSCGTSTAVSVPCMFSPLSRTDYDSAEFKRTLNALDVLQKQGVQVLWRDNNSDSKGVAERVEYQDFKSPTVNPVCDEECRDIGMLSGLDDYIETHRGKDLLIVLHQMGNHGPAYYKRYPAEFEKFTPVCRTNEFSECSTEEITNAYDNAILYTDHFLFQTIEFLKKYDADYETAMLYISDHGESLGEMGLYLHGAPMAFAPEVQTHVASVGWVGQHFDVEAADLAKLENIPLSHDNLFCGLLLGFEVESNFCPENAKLLAAEHADLPKQ